MTCEVCRKNPAKGVASSVFGPISHAYCQECLDANREVYGTLVCGLAGVGRDEVAEWAKPFIVATCALHSKTADEFWADVDKLTEEMYGAMQSESESAAPVPAPVGVAHDWDVRDPDPPEPICICPPPGHPMYGHPDTFGACEFCYNNAAKVPA